jgi:putative FmdB family regulatory protein
VIPRSRETCSEATLPIYDYRCTSCGQLFEARQSFNDEPGAPCPACGDRSERLITAVAVHFKGSGFYKTDYKSSGNGRPSSNGSDKSAESKTDSKSDSKSDSKTESKSESKPEANSSSSSSSKESSKDSSGSKAKETAAKSDK